MNRRSFIIRILRWLKSIALLSFLPASAVLAAVEPEDEGKLHYRPLKSLTLKEIATKKIHHGEDGRYLNPLGELRHKRRLGRVLYWKLFKENRFKSYLADQRVIPVALDWGPVKNSSGLSITFIKHATVMIKDVDRYIIVDPVFNDIFWFIKDFSPPAFNLKDIPAPDHILITHGHYDHIDKQSLGHFDKNTHVISPLGYNDIFDDLGMKKQTGMDWYDTYRDGRCEITLLPCNHWTMRSPIQGPNRSLWGSYVIKTSGGKTIYISGDTAYFDGFEDIGKEFDIDLAVFNLGAYEPRWFMAPSHINPSETVRAFKELRAKKLMIVHWGTFQLGDEPVHFPPLDLKKELEKEGLLDRWVKIKHGETYFMI